MTDQMQAVLMIANYPSIKNVMMPIIDVEREDIRWPDLSYGVLSGGQKAAISWLWAIWTDEKPPKGWRDPFEGFFSMDRELMEIILKAMRLRHGLDKPLNNFEKWVADETARAPRMELIRDGGAK